MNAIDAMPVELFWIMVFSIVLVVSLVSER